MKPYTDYAILLPLWEAFDNANDAADALAVAKEIQFASPHTDEEVRNAQDAIKVARVQQNYTYIQEYSTIVVKNDYYAVFFVDEDGILIDAEFNLDMKDVVPAYIEMADKVEANGAGGYATNANGRLYHTGIPSARPKR